MTPLKSRVLVSLLVLGAALSAGAAAAGDRSMILATTTSVRDSGLLDALLPGFTKKTGIDVRVIAVGTGAALRMGREGNADLLLTHAPAAEEELVEAGIVTRRTPFMQNYFVIAGPATDPAGVKAAATPEEAIQTIIQAGAGWVSRSDDSGTHKREKALFEAAGLDPETDRKDLVRTGTGMGLSLQVAGQRRTYVLSDIGTFLAFKERIDLVALSRSSPSLRNVYSILQLDSERFERPLHTSEAEALEAYLLDSATQEEIGQFGRERFGRALFTPLHASDASAARPPASPGQRTSKSD